MARVTAQLLESELRFTTSRSGGPGGQNVNKVNSKVTLQFDVQNSRILTDDQKNTIVEKLSSRLTRDGLLTLTAQESRSQIGNKATVLEKFDKLLASAFMKKKARKATKPSKAARRERLKKKKVVSEKKKWRRKPDL